MKVTNRSDGTVTYSLDEFNIRRVFNINETKEIEEKELQALFQQDGGNFLVRHYLMVHDEAWVMRHFNAPMEYFWNVAQITACVKNDSLELFSETLDYAPEGVKDIIKSLSWKLPLTDLNKIQIIQDKLDFNVMAAIAIMSESKPVAAQPKKERLRQRVAKE